MATSNNAEEKEPNPNDDFGVPDEDDAADIEPAAAPSAKAKPQEKPAKPVISSALRRAAKSFGIPEDDIENSSPEALQEAIALMAEDRQERSRVKAAPEDEEEEEEEDDDDAELNELDTALALDPKFKNYLKNKSKNSAKEIKALKAALESQAKREQQRSAIAARDAADEAFDALGETFAPIFGEGGYGQLVKGSKEFKRRVQVVQAAMLEADDSPSVIKRKIVAAAKETFGDFVGVTKKAKAAQEEAVEDEEDTYVAPKKRVVGKPKGDRGPIENLDEGNAEIDWEEAATARPTNRKANDKPGRKKAIQAVRQYYQENGVPGASGGDDLDNVPD